MLRRFVFAALTSLTISCASVAPRAIENPTIAYPFNAQSLDRADIGNCASHLVKMSGYGRMPFERAAFLILREDGTFDCSMWPATFQLKKEQWSGAIPDRTAAIIHTHPLSLPDPSAHDMREAARLGVPVIVATPEVLAMAQPRGGVTRVATLGMTR